MSTSDPFDVPPELRGLVSQVSAGTNTSPLGGSPGPGALAGSTPGVNAGVVAPIAAPTLPDPTDPAAMAVFLTRLANEMFLGSPAAPVPSPQQVMTGAAAPAEPAVGVSPAIAPVAPSAPSAAPDPAGATISTTPLLAGAAAPDELVLPVDEGLLAGSLDEVSLVESSPASPASPPNPANLSNPPNPASLSNPSNPFGATSLDGFDPFGTFSADGLDPFGAIAVMRMPIVDAPRAGAAPHYLPSTGAVTLESAPRIEPATEHSPAIRQLGGTAFDPYAARRDFPILEERVHGKRLVWLDNAATTQKPRAVIDRLARYYERENSNVHRGAHTLAARATDAYETGREITRRFLNAPSAQEIVFVRGATEGINLVAQSWGRRHVQRGDEIVVTHLEHHANIVPWQQLCAERGARLRVAPVDDRGDVILEEYERLLNPRTRLVAFPHVSNALGTITPARTMIEMAHRHGAVVLVDGAQAVSHMRVDVQALDCDFYVFSGHKVYAPTGIGAVFGKRDVLAHMPPWQGGGNMIQDVTFERTAYQPPPMRFEAGTGNIADAAGLGAALEYVMRIGMDVIDRYEHDLLVYGTERLATVPGLRMIGTSPNKAGVLSFVLDGQRTEDVGAALDKDGIAVRSGHHCAQPIHRRFGLEGSVRASLAFYNVCEDIDALVAALHRLQGGR